MSTKITGVKTLNNYIAKMKSHLKNPSSFFAKAGEVGRSNITRHFYETKSPKGTWKKLKYRKGLPLNDNGVLRGSITYKSNNKSATIGTNEPYATIHNYGGMAGKGKKVKIPKREFMWLDKNAYKQMENAMIDTLEDLWV